MQQTSKQQSEGVAKLEEDAREAAQGERDHLCEQGALSPPTPQEWSQQSHDGLGKSDRRLVRTILRISDQPPSDAALGRNTVEVHVLRHPHFETQDLTDDPGGSSQGAVCNGEQPRKPPPSEQLQVRQTSVATFQALLGRRAGVAVPNPNQKADLAVKRARQLASHVKAKGWDPRTPWEGISELEYARQEVNAMAQTAAPGATPPAPAELEEQARMLVTQQQQAQPPSNLPHPLAHSKTLQYPPIPSNAVEHPPIPTTLQHPPIPSTTLQLHYPPTPTPSNPNTLQSWYPLAGTGPFAGCLQCTHSTTRLADHPHPKAGTSPFAGFLQYSHSNNNTFQPTPCSQPATSTSGYLPLCNLSGLSLSGQGVRQGTWCEVGSRSP